MTDAEFQDDLKRIEDDIDSEKLPVDHLEEWPAKDAPDDEDGMDEPNEKHD